jgi:hypothetical protein
VNRIDPWGLIWQSTGVRYNNKAKSAGRIILNRVGNLIGSGMDPSVIGK